MEALSSGSYTGGTVSTAYDASFGGSPPNGIVATSGAGYTYWPSADLYINFAIPVNGLSFRILGSQAGGSSALIDVYSNNIYYTTINYNSGHGFPGQILPPQTINLSGIPHITRVALRYVQNYDYWFNTAYPLYYDDFTFTPELTVNVASPRISGGLDQTTQNALLGADISLQASASLNGSPLSGGSYSWTFTGPASTNSQAGQSVTIRSTDTSDHSGPIVAKATYTLNNVSVTATVNINVILPTLTSFTGTQGSSLISSSNACASQDSEPSWSFFRLGCGSSILGMTFNAQVHVPTLISDPSQSGVKYVQAISAFEKYTERGVRCETARTTQPDVDSGWQLDTKDPANLQGYDVKRFSQGNDLTSLMVDYPATALTGYGSYWFKDNLLVG